MAGKDTKYEKKDIIKDFIFFILTVAAAYGYILLMLMILSFMFASVLPLKFEHMLIISGIGAVAVAVWYVKKKSEKYKK